MNRLPLPTRGLEVEQLIMTSKGVSALFPKQGDPPRHIARYRDGKWVRLAEVPNDFRHLMAPKSFELWGIWNATLFHWDEPGWSATKLPTDDRFGSLHWQSVWQRGPTDVWIIAEERNSKTGTSRVYLFNSANGRQTASIPRLGERVVPGNVPSGEASETATLPCAHPYADFLKLTPFLFGMETPPTMRHEEARRVLQALLARRAELSKLRFVIHRCYGEHCIGAVVESAQQAETIRKALEDSITQFARMPPTTDGISNMSPKEYLGSLVSRDALRCDPPPLVVPFAVPR